MLDRGDPKREPKELPMPDIRVLLSRFQARVRCIAGRRVWGGTSHEL